MKMLFDALTLDLGRGESFIMIGYRYIGFLGCSISGLNSIWFGDSFWFAVDVLDWREMGLANDMWRISELTSSH